MCVGSVCSLVGSVCVALCMGSVCVALLGVCV